MSCQNAAHVMITSSVTFVHCWHENGSDKMLYWHITMSDTMCSFFLFRRKWMRSAYFSYIAVYFSGVHQIVCRLDDWINFSIINLYHDMANLCKISFKKCTWYSTKLMVFHFYTLRHSNLWWPPKLQWPMCWIEGDLLAEKEYKIYNYVFISV